MTCILVLGDGRVACGSNNGAMHVWDMATMQRTLTLRGCHVFPIKQLMELPDGRLVSTERARTPREMSYVPYRQQQEQQQQAAACSQTMLVWDLSDGSCTSVHEDHVGGLLWRCCRVLRAC